MERELIVRLVLTNEALAAWENGQGAHLEAGALEQAERAAKVRFMGRTVQVRPAGATPGWMVESGASRLYLDCKFLVSVN